MRIAVAMSGGVDSSLTAILLQEQGHDIIGLTAKILMCEEMDGSEPRYDVCCSPESINDARRVALEAGFSHHIINVEDDFSHEIVDPFCGEYLRGRTPSPCIHCNARIKFRHLMDRAAELGCQALATGHYAGVGHTPEGRYYVTAGKDPVKDQSYFLFSLSQQILEYVIFPLGGYTKQDIRRMAREHSLHVAERPESQEICFIPDDDYPAYIQRHTGITPPPGDIVDTTGKVIGRHRGIHRYTIGQRRGLGIAAPHPLYVVEIDAENNTIIAGPREALNRDGLTAANISYMKTTSLHDIHARVKTRSTQTPFRASLTEENGEVRVLFDEPHTGITPGQASVFYDEKGDILGGGWIEKSF